MHERKNGGRVLKVQPIILAGGSGSRLWPVSREAYPKQLLNLTGPKTLLQKTLERVARLNNIYPPILVVGEKHKFIIKRQVEELGIFKKIIVMLEPLGRSTAPAISGAVEYVSQHKSKDTVVMVFPSDHLITNDDSFVEAARNAALLAEQGRIVTFGIQPDKPETGYGYIEKGEGCEVLSFKEKPDLQLAEKLLAKGNYYWNSGMFVFKASSFHQEMKLYAPRMLEQMTDAIKNGHNDGDFFCFDAESMGDVENTSIDQVLMEKTKKAAVIPVDFGWIDIGSWQALWNILEKDNSGNAVKGDVVLRDTSNSLVMSEGKLVAVVGLKDTMVVETGDALLVAAMSSAQDIKKIVEHLREKNRSECCYHHTFHRPWGRFTILDKQQRYCIRKVVVDPGGKLSLQKHYHRHEHWVVVSGTAKVTNGKEVRLLHENESVLISAGVVHRLENPGRVALKIIEMQIGSYLGEDDIVQYEDEYGRSSQR